jgi:hypothetical protein
MLLKEIIGTQAGIEHITIRFECRNCGQGPVVCLDEAKATTIPLS